MLGLRARIAITAIAATAAALVAVLLIALPGLRERTTQQAGVQLDAQARLVARLVQPPLAAGADRATLDALVDAAGRDLGERVTVIAPDGRVLADSAASDAALDALDNHGDRPEVRSALRDGRGAAVRHSATVDEDLLYSAVAVRDGSRLLGVARVALPLAGVRAQARHFGRAVLWALVVAFAITAVLSALFASSLAGPLESIMDAARQFAAGNLEARSRVVADGRAGRARAHPQPLGGPAARPAHRDRARPRAHGRDPVGDGGRRARGRPRRRGSAREPRARREPRPARPRRPPVRRGRPPARGGRGARSTCCARASAAWRRPSSTTCAACTR